jgi:hypothetical protein
MGTVIGNSVGIPFGGGKSWSAYWATRYPSNVVVTVLSSTSIRVTHTNNGTQDFTGISYEISPSDQLHFTENTTAAPGTTSKDITGLTADTLYYVRLRYYKG